MAFSSVQFLFVFLPLSLAVYWLCPKWLRNAVLAAFSLLFCAWAGLKGAAILVLLAGIALLVSRQVVLPVRSASRIAERFAEAKKIEAAVGHVSNHSDGAGTTGAPSS